MSAAKGKAYALQLASVMKVARGLSGSSLRQYAKHLGIPPATLSRIENGKGCDLDTLVRIRQATGICYAMLLEGGTL